MGSPTPPSARAISSISPTNRHALRALSLTARSDRAARSGWERWWVPSAVVRHEYRAVIDKHFFTRRNLWHLRGMLRFLRKHPERLLALR